MPGAMDVHRPASVRARSWRPRRPRLLVVGTGATAPLKRCRRSIVATATEHQGSIQGSVLSKSDRSEAELTPANTGDLAPPDPLRRPHNPKVAGSNPGAAVRGSPAPAGLFRGRWASIAADFVPFSYQFVGKDRLGRFRPVGERSICCAGRGRETPDRCRGRGRRVPGLYAGGGCGCQQGARPEIAASLTAAGHDAWLAPRDCTPRWAARPR
jgi:hypothetical protein